MATIQDLPSGEALSSARPKIVANFGALNAELGQKETPAGAQAKADAAQAAAIAASAPASHTHPASAITEDSAHRFVTDTEKTTWGIDQTARDDIAAEIAARGDADSAHESSLEAHAAGQPWVAGFRQTVPFTSDVFTEVKTGSGSTVRRGVAGSVASGSTAGSTAFLKSDMGGAIGFVPVPWFGDASGYSSPDWRKTIVFDMIISGQGAQAADGVARWTIGKTTGSLGDIPRLGIQLSLKGAGAASRLWLGVHNGTAFSESDTGFVLNRSWAAYAVKIISRAGTVELYVNDALGAKTPTFTRTGGPAIKDTTGSQVWYTLETTNGTSAADHRMDINLLTVSTVY